MPRTLPLGLFLTVAVTVQAAIGAEAPLHQRIDQAIAAGPDFNKLAAAPASDEEFLRRIYLDLTGTIPTSADARAFLADTVSDRRAKLIDRLLNSPEHARHMAHVFDVVLMDRRLDKNVQRAAWHEYLRSSFAANKPWDVLVREILSADGVDPQQRAMAKFYLDRDAEPHQLTRDVSRLFLGKNYHCAQCHDHPLVDDYKQEHYYGIYAFLSRSYLFTDKAKKQPAVLAEKADGDVTFQSVFDPAKTTKSTGPRLLDGKPVAEPKIEKGKEYQVAPAADVRPVPTFSRRALLAPTIASRDNAQFRRASANRFWALLLGRGLIHPLDLDHSANPPSHPELLNLLADEFGKMDFDIRAFLREVALSQTYQRSSLPPAGVEEVPPSSFAVALLKPLTPEQLAMAVLQATGQTDVERAGLAKGVTEATLYPRLAQTLNSFVNVFASRSGQPAGNFEATLDQTLFLANGGLIRGWLSPGKVNLTGRLTALTDSDAVAEELYLSVLTRKPSADERKEVAEYLKTRTQDRPAALGELVWALVASAEFRFNH